MKKVYVLIREEAECGYGHCPRILGIYSTETLANEYLQRFQQKPEYGHKSDDYWIDEYELDVDPE